MKPIVLNDTGDKHIVLPDTGKLDVEAIPVSPDTNNTVVMRSNGLYVPATEVSVTRRTLVAGISLQIERYPATGVQIIRLRANFTSQNTDGYQLSWDSHPFAGTDIFQSHTASMLSALRMQNLTTTGGTLQVNSAVGVQTYKLEGYY